MVKVLVSDPLAEAGVAILRDGADVDVRTGLPREELLAILPEYDALIVRSETKVTAEVLAAGTNLRVVTRAGVGTDNIDVAAATEQGILVLNTPGPNSIAAAEHTLAVTLSLLRHVARADASLRAGKWERKSFVGSELYRKTLGVVGLGRIGREVTSRARAFGMDVLIYDPYRFRRRRRSAGRDRRAARFAAGARRCRHPPSAAAPGDARNPGYA